MMMIGGSSNLLDDHYYFRRRNRCHRTRSSNVFPRRMMVASSVIMVLLVGLLFNSINAQQQIQTSASNIVRVRYGYFTESRPIHVGCGRRRPNTSTTTGDSSSGGSWFDLYDSSSDTYYQVICYPQTSGSFAVSRLDNTMLIKN